MASAEQRERDERESEYEYEKERGGPPSVCRTIHMEIQLESSQATFLLLGIYNSGAETVCQDANSVKNFCRQVSSN